jgi:hypothetical protein
MRLDTKLLGVLIPVVLAIGGGIVHMDQQLVQLEQHVADMDRRLTAIEYRLNAHAENE